MIGHFEDADFIGGAIAVLDRAQDAELMATLTFEIEHRVNHMFEHPGAGDLPFLGDMADQHKHDIPLLGDPDQFLGRGADLRNRTRRAFHGFDIHGLNRIDDHHLRRFLAIQAGQDIP